jgi:hypothetical protein
VGKRKNFQHVPVLSLLCDNDANICTKGECVFKTHNNLLGKVKASNERMGIEGYRIASSISLEIGPL